MDLAHRIKDLEESATLSLNQKAKELEARGEKIINLTAGEPDFNTAFYIKKAAIQAIKDGFTKYTASAGVRALRKVIIQQYHQEKKLNYFEDEVTVTVGAKQGLYNIFQVILNDKDEVIIPYPYWVSFLAQVKLASGKPILVKTKKDFDLDIKEIKKNIGPKTKAIILNSPNNPTGFVYPKRTLLNLIEVIRGKKIWLIWDEVYEKIIYGVKHHCPVSLLPQIKNQTLIVNAVSKSYMMTGFRIGYVLGPANVISALTKLQSQSASCAPSISQMAAFTALSKKNNEFPKELKEFKKRRNYLVKQINNIKGLQVQKPLGTFYLFIDINKVMKDSIKFCQWLLEKEKVILVPGSAFGLEGYVRLSYATPIEHLREVVRRLKRFCDSEIKIKIKN